MFVCEYGSSLLRETIDIDRRLLDSKKGLERE